MRTGKTLVVAVLFTLLTVPALADDLPQIPEDTGIQSGFPTDPDQGKSFQVDCYLGNPDEGRNVGSLMVTARNEAGPACNATYACDHKCYGCLNDGSNVCYDWLGGKYQR